MKSAVITHVTGLHDLINGATIYLILMRKQPANPPNMIRQIGGSPKGGGRNDHCAI